MTRTMAAIPDTLAVERTIPLSVPVLRGNEWKYLKECLDTGWVSSVGPFVDRFERDLATYVGAAHAVAVVNGTAGLHMALRVVGIEPEDEVMVSTLTFIAPVNAIRYCQAHPVFVDAHPATWQMDVEKAARFLAQECEVRHGACYNRRSGRRVSAILPVHILGLACEMDRILELARTYHLKVVEDAAEGMGVRFRGRHVGTFGDVGVLSFNGNKIITSGGGGMVVTHSPDSAASVRYLTTQAKDDEREYIHNEVGYNYRLTNLQAAVGVAQLEQLEGFIAKKRAIARAYEQAFSGLDGVVLMPTPAHTEPTYWLYTILVRDRRQRDALLARLAEEGIEARPLWQPIHTQRPYHGCQAAGPITVATELYERAVSLPSSVGLSETDVQHCAGRVRRLLQQGSGT